MSFSHFCSVPRTSTTNLLSITHPKHALLRLKRPLGYVKLFVLFYLPFNIALAGEIFSTGFESGSTDAGKSQQNGFFWQPSKRTSVSTENPKTGNYSLKLRFNAVNDNIKFSNSAQYFALGGFYPDLWIKYDLFVPLNYTHRKSGGAGAYNNKFIMVWGGDYSDKTKKEGPKLGAHYYPSNDGQSKLIAYVGARINGVPTLDKNWTCPTCDDGRSDNGIRNSDKGHWMTLVIHMKYASIANNDGVYEVWKTDWQGQTDKLIDIHNGPWYSTKPFSNEPARGFDSGYILGWANSGFVDETVFYIDNITFSTNPLSADSQFNNTAAPKPPTISLN